MCKKCLLTIEEAAAYSSIGVNKLRALTNDETCPFVLHVSANKRLIKRKAFEKFINNSYSL
ncbi:helix-turn-helix domain-containing protein [Butyricicoccus sp. MSJd-7]|uniref:Helix-turn-helix domain-containing protein n=1 Tax=Butyricicoccus intestinisimiae TaxID=2841509 RepID=A0ABS6ENX0_9FIRM|nr:helix-turn-helix domain-containing protein [Butyricicoccus intestinisimiae]